MSGLRLYAHQTRYDLLTFSRNREAVFFTVALPLIFLVIFAAIFWIFSFFMSLALTLRDRVKSK